MADWSEGYVTDVPYDDFYFGECSPLLLRFLALLQGVRPAGLGTTWTYLDLGCASGFSLCLLAAAQPTGRFVGVDFNPVHVHNARTLAAQAGLDNVEFVELSFSDLDQLRLPPLDYAVLQGVYSWVNRDNRAALQRFLARAMAPGGLVYVSYNTLPGWAPLQPLRELLQRASAHWTGSSPLRLEASVSLAHQLTAFDTGFFGQNPLAVQQLSTMEGRPSAYLCHEYLNAGVEAFYHADVATALRAAKLEFLGSAVFVENHDDLVVSAEAQELLDQLEEPALRETVRDFILNRRFRRDVFVRGRATLARREHALLLGQAQVARLVARPFDPTVLYRGNETRLPQALVEGLGEALAEGPQTVGDLYQRPELQPYGLLGVAKALGVLHSTSQVEFVDAPTDGGVTRERCERLNRVLLAGLLSERPPDALAGPLAGNGVRITPLEWLALRALRTGPSDLSAALAVQVKQAEKQMQEAGRAVPTEAAALEAWVQRFESERLPALEALGLV